MTIGLILACITTFFIAVISLQSLGNFTDRLDKADDTNRIIKFVLDARTSEKNYLLYNETAEIRNVTLLVEQIKKQAIETRNQYSSSENIRQMDKVLRFAESYQKLFERYVEIDGVADNHQREMERAAREVEIVVDQLRARQKRQLKELIMGGGKDISDELQEADAANRLIKYLLQIRRDEKNFNMRNNTAYAEQVFEGINSLILQAQELKEISERESSRGAAVAVLKEITDYRKRFAAFAEGQNEQMQIIPQLLNKARGLEKEATDAREDQKSELNLSIRTSEWLIGIGFIISLIIVFLFTYLLNISVTKPLRRVVSAMINVSKSREVSSNLLDQRINIKSEDEIGVLVRAFNMFVEKTAAAQEESINRYIAIQQSSVSILITNEKGLIEYVNPFFTKLTGYSYEEAIGNKLNIFESEYQSTIFDTQFWDAIISVNGWEGEIMNKKKNGDLYWEKAIISPIRNNEGLLTHFVAIKEDITERKKMYEELLEAKEKAQESDRLKSSFLANMSHEIRTPMNGILGFADILKDTNLTGDEQKEYLGIIERSGRRMLNIINDIVDISQIEAGLMKVDLRECNINEQIEYIYTFFKPEVDAKGMKITFKNALPDNVAVVITDREKVYAILTNLVKNAIKYSEQGTIELGYSVATRNALSLLQFYVKDTGIGIPKDRQEAIFERFIQADVVNKRARQGAGLGLSIAKSYVEMLGGKLWVESKEGVGSTFYFILPYNTEPEEKKVVGKVVPAQEEKIQIKKLKILIAEDDEVSEMLIEKTVSLFGKEIIKARTGVEAVDVCKNNPDIDLVLMDVGMPEMDGYEATRQIREFNKAVVIIAVTAYGLSLERGKAFKLGCNDYIAKPFRKVAMHELIQKYFGNASA